MNTFHATEKNYTVTEFAKIMGFSRQTVLSWINKKKINAFRIDKQFRIPESELKRIKGE